MIKYADEIINSVEQNKFIKDLLDITCESGQKYTTFDGSWKSKITLKVLIPYEEVPYKTKKGENRINRRIVKNPENVKSSRQEKTQDKILDTERKIDEIHIGIKFLVQEAKKQKNNNPDKVEPELELPF